MGTEFWAGHVAAATRETVSASEYARRHGISVVLAAHAENHHRQSAKKVSTPAKPAHARSFVELRVLDKQRATLSVYPGITVRVAPENVGAARTFTVNSPWLRHAGNTLMHQGV